MKKSFKDREDGALLHLVRECTNIHTLVHILHLLNDVLYLISLILIMTFYRVQTLTKNCYKF